MRLLLDTHAFLWWATDTARLSHEVRQCCENADNRVLLSVASVWEMQIKMQSRRLVLRCTLAELVEKQCRENNVRLVPIELAHVLKLDELPARHKDPFDRLIVAQAIVEGLTVASTDKVIAQYPIRILW